MRTVPSRPTLALLVITALALAACGHESPTGRDPAIDRAADNVGLRTDFRAHFTRYAEVTCPEQERIRTLWANDAAVAAARDGRPMPVGAVLVSELSTLDTANGRFIAGMLRKLAVTRRVAVTAGKDTIRDYDWRGTTVEGQSIFNEGCKDCHFEARPTGFLFTVDELAYVARKAGPTPAEPLRHPTTFSTTECH